MPEFILYSYFRSSCSYRVRIALNIKQIKHEYRPIHLLNQGGEQHTAEYRKLNPSREVPTLVHKGRVLTQSMAILEYLDAIAPGPPLFPQDPYERARVVQACEVINSGIQPIGNLKVQQELEKRFGADAQGKADWTAYWIRLGFESLERILAGTAQTYSFGDKITAADLFVVPQVFNANRFNVNMSAFPTIERINEKCLELTAFKQAAPESQPDMPLKA